MPVSQEAHAGCLSFELSAKQQRIVVNCGLPATSRESWRQVARATAAHSTVTFNDTSSCRFLESGSFKRMLFGTPIIGGPREVAVTREEQPDGVAAARLARRLCRPLQRRPSARAHAARRRPPARRRGPVHAGERRSDARRTAIEFAVRFHLHPSVKANELTDGHGAMLLLPNKEVWTFNAYEDRVELEESVYLAGPDGPRRTRADS